MPTEKTITEQSPIKNGTDKPANSFSTSAPSFLALQATKITPKRAQDQFMGSDYWRETGKPVLAMFAIPLTVICLLCIVTFVGLHNQHRNALYQNTEQLAVNYFGQYTNTQGKTIQPVITEELFKQKAEIILQTGLFTSLSLFSAEKQLLAYSGLPYGRNYQNSAIEHIENNQHSSLYRIFPLPRNNAEPLWIVATVDKSPSSILFLKTLLWGVGCFLLAIVLIIVLTIRCHNKLVAPIHQLNNELRQAMNGVRDTPLTLHTVHTKVIASVQQLLDINRGLRDGTQKYIEQATQELRETLETVEIQNIELDIARKNALKSSDDKSELLASTSHEIRTPLNGILGFTHLLQKTTLTDQQKDYLATIEQSSQGLLTVINDIIDYARLESDAITFEYKPVNIRDILSEVLLTHAPSANENHLKLIQHIDPLMPNNLLGDPLRLKQVINNLIHGLLGISSSGNLIIESNVLKQQDSKTKLHFSVRHPSAEATQSQAAHIRMAIANTASETVNDATCLGLTIARSLTERMGGTLTTDMGDNGIAFHFEILLGHDTKEHDAPPQTTLRSHAASNPSRQKHNVVIFDSNSYSRQELLLEAESWGIKATTETDILKLPSTIQAQKAQLVIVDCSTSGRRFNKEDLLRHIEPLADDQGLHVAIVAPSNIQRQLEPILSDKGVSFLTRPIEHQAFARLLDHASGSHHEKTEERTKQRPLNILVADDNPANSKLVCAFLQNDHHNITVVENGREAVESYATNKPDIIFMDVQMPEMDGLVATQTIRSKESPMSRVPIVALTANAMSEQRTRILMSGMDDYLTKPVSDEDLRHALRRWVTLSQQTQAQHNQQVQTQQAQSSPVKDQQNNLSSESNNKQSQHAKVQHQSSSKIVNKQTAVDLEPLTSPDSIDSTVQNDQLYCSHSIKSSVKLDHIMQNASDTQTAGPALFSLEKSLSLTKGNAKLALEMLEMLLQELPHFQTTLDMALIEKSPSAVYEELHKLKGGVAYTGLLKLHHLTEKAHNSLSNNRTAEQQENNDAKAELLVTLAELSKTIQETREFFEEMDITALFN